ncbi:MAG TPA: hypothetical protein VLH39_05675, partial [Magnetospirillaceae bacterium]|nr:hypothetical protein [Magnetospirillaceae bacterium]
FKKSGGHELPKNGLVLIVVPEVRHAPPLGPQYAKLCPDREVTGQPQLVNSIVWGPPFLVLLVGTGVYLSVRLGFFQFTGLGLA